jgi:hypothetical protein
LDDGATFEVVKNFPTFDDAARRSLCAIDRDPVVLEDVEDTAVGDEGLASAERRLDLERVFALIHRLGPPDREVMLPYLEDLDAAAIGVSTSCASRSR